MVNLVPTQTQLLLFDMHTCLQPVDNPELFTPEFSFLGWPNDYNENYNNGLVLHTNHFEITPLRSSEIDNNHFWRRLHLPSKNAWYAHLPLVAHPKNTFKVELVAEGLEFSIPVKTWVFVWPWGWSANLGIELDKVPLQTLAELTASFKSSHCRNPFILNGNLVKPTQIFHKLGEMISYEIYKGGDTSRTALIRHFILSVLTSEGDMLQYDPIHFGVRRISVQDRQELQSILLGKTINIQDLSLRENQSPRPFLLTRFTGAAFALTDYEQGSVLVLHGLKPNEIDIDNLVRAKCLAGNVKNCAALSFGLAAVLEDGFTYQNAGARINALLKSARDVLCKMRHISTNYLWQGYLKNPRVQKAINCT